MTGNSGYCQLPGNLQDAVYSFPMRLILSYLLFLVPAVLSAALQVAEVSDLGKIVDARSIGSYNAGRTSLIRDGDALHLTFATSGRPYVLGESPRWDPDRRSYGVDRIRYLQLDPETGARLSADPEPVIEAQMATGDRTGSPERGIGYWREDQLQGGCTNSVVEFEGRYWMFFENLFHHEDARRDGAREIPANELVGIFVARTPTGTTPGPGVTWEVLCEDDVWRPLARTRGIRWKPILRPMVARLHDSGGERAWDLYEQFHYKEIWGAGVPSAVVADGRILLYFWDGSHKLGALWECRREERPFSYRGREVDPGPTAHWGRDAKVPFEVESLRVAYGPGDLEAFDRHAGDLDIAEAPSAVESAYAMCVGDAWRAQRVRLLPEGFADRFVAFHLADAPDDPGRARLMARLSRDGLRWSGPEALMTLDFDPFPFDGWDRYPDEFVTVEADPRGRIPRGDRLVFLYQRAWHSRVDTPLIDHLRPADEHPPLLYPGGFNLYGFSATLVEGGRAAGSPLPFLGPETGPSCPLRERVLVSRVQRFGGQLLLKWGRGSGPVPETIHAALMEADGTGNWRSSGRVEAVLSADPFWPGTLWHGVSGKVDGVPLLDWIDRADRAAVLEIPDGSPCGGRVRVAVPGPALAGDSPTAGYRPVMVHAASAFRPAPESPATRVLRLHGFFDPYCGEGGCSEATLYFSHPQKGCKPVTAGLRDIAEAPTASNPVLTTSVDPATRMRVYTIRVPDACRHLPQAAWNLEDGWRCVVGIVDGLKGPRDRILFPLKDRS